MDVASSINKIFGFEQRALAIHINYFYPLLKLSPFPVILKFNLSLSVVTSTLSTKFSFSLLKTLSSFSSSYYFYEENIIESHKNAFIKAFFIVSSLNLFIGSIFSLNVPSIKNGSYGMTYIFSLRCLNPISLISISFINIFPSLQTSRILVNALSKVDFPDPVHPTTPIFSACFISNETLFKTIGVLSLYLISKFFA